MKKTKGILFTGLACLMIGASAFGMASCKIDLGLILPPTGNSESSSPGTHQHTYAASVTAPTCTEQGFTTYTCTCGESYVDTYVDKLGHNFIDYECEHCDLKASKGLEYTPNADGETYSVSGIGSCKDTDLVIPNTYNGKRVTAIADMAFIDQESMAASPTYHFTSVTLPDSLETIGVGSFAGMVHVRSLDIPNGVTYIGLLAFQLCNFKEVSISATVTEIGEGAFAGCSTLTEISVDENNQNYKSIDGNLYTKDGKTLLLYALGKENTAFEIPHGVETIGSGAFAVAPTDLNGNILPVSNLAEVTIPNSVVSIGANAFNGLNITSIEIPDSVETIGVAAFYNCANLTSVAIGDSVTSIGGHAFSWCANLTSVVIPDSVRSIGEYAFSYCTSLTSVVIGDSVTSIGEDAFSSCTSLTSVTIPNSVTSIGASAFNNCTSLTSVYYKGTAEDWKKISISSINYSYLASATRYYYVEKEKDVPTDGGNYWHYDTNGVPTKW